MAICQAPAAPRRATTLASPPVRPATTAHPAALAHEMERSAGFIGPSVSENCVHNAVAAWREAHAATNPASAVSIFHIAWFIVPRFNVGVWLKHPYPENPRRNSFGAIQSRHCQRGRFVERRIQPGILLQSNACSTHVNPACLEAAK